MLRRLFVAGVIATAVAANSADLSACGDKFLRIGRSPRLRAWAAVHPATILVYRPANATAKGIKEFEASLKRAGHRTVVLERGAGLSQALTAAEYDVVIADYVDSARIKGELGAIPSRPSLLPILNSPSKAVAAEAETQYCCLIKPDEMSKYDALEEIDHLIELRLNGTAPPR